MQRLYCFFFTIFFIKKEKNLGKKNTNAGVFNWIKNYGYSELKKTEVFNWYDENGELKKSSVWNWFKNDENDELKKIGF